MSNVIIPPDSSLVSFDVVGLYPHIPKGLTIQVMGELLVKAGCDHEVITEFFDLLRTCWSPNFCQYNYKFYEFPEEVGIPIGSPLGSLISEVFMHLYEETLFSSNHILLSHVTYWHRYVDDVLCLWEGHHSLAGNFLNFPNSLFPSIKFTMEMGGESINFLDLTIRNKDGTHAFSVYRKSTVTDSIIDGRSFCPWPHKLAALECYIHGLVSIPMGREDFEAEANRIEYLANVNHIRIYVRRMIQKKISRSHHDLTISIPRRSDLNCREKYTEFLDMSIWRERAKKF